MAPSPCSHACCGGTAKDPMDYSLWKESNHIYYSWTLNGLSML